MTHANFNIYAEDWACLAADAAQVADLMTYAKSRGVFLMTPHQTKPDPALRNHPDRLEIGAVFNSGLVAYPTKRIPSARVLMVTPDQFRAACDRFAAKTPHA